LLKVKHKNPCNLDLCPKTLEFSRFLEIVEVHTFVQNFITHDELSC